ncbi:hypothetical protein [Bacillus alkalisoli]|uniref:hypothetical protein n=1 Tax=Bacillus alkalisoli TaxID=2011008 RepID=UPI000C2389D8|nr:hypothetical protein [Bacillus alkalisoli]
MEREERKKSQQLTEKEKAVDSLVFSGLFQAITTRKKDFNKKVILTLVIAGTSTSLYLLAIWIIDTF